MEDFLKVTMQYNAEHPLGSGIGFTEEDEPNFKGSFYSYTKTLAEKVNNL